MAEESTREPRDDDAETADTDAVSPVDAAADAPTPPETVSAAPPESFHRGRLLSSLVPKLAIVVAIAATLIAGALWWQYRRFYVELASEDVFLLENIEEARANLRGLEDEIGAVEGAVSADRSEIEGLREDLQVLPAELRALERRVETLQGGQIDARDSWLREQAEYYLVLASTQLRLARSVESSITALELADDVLRDLGDPALGDVRSAIAEALQNLRATGQADLEGVGAELAGLIERVPDLPMRAAAPENFGAPQESLDDVEPGLGRLWERTRGAVTSIVRIERQEEPVGVVLTESERRLVRRQLALELQLARTAVIEGRQETFRASLVAADAILNQDFARNAPAIVETRRLLAEMMQIELRPALPDISDPLTLFRNAAGSE